MAARILRATTIGPQARCSGALEVNTNLSGKLTAVTAMQSFDLFITCEQTQTVTIPATLELLPFHYPSGTP